MQVTTPTETSLGHAFGSNDSREHDQSPLRQCRFLFVSTGLSMGGAEVVLAQLVKSLAGDGCECRVISLIAEGPVGTLIRAAGVEIESLNMPRGRITWHGIRQLAGIIRRFQPNLVQTWMYHADLVGG